MSTMQLISPLFLITSSETCYRCGAISRVAAIACRRILEDQDSRSGLGGDVDTEPKLIENVANLPQPLLDTIRGIHQHYEKRRSRTAGCDYFMNVCEHCGAHFGDFFLHAEPGGAFFPVSEEALSSIEIRQLPVEGTFEVEGGYGIGIGSEIFAKGRMVS